MIKRICTALIAVMIGAGAFTVPAFAYTGEDTGSAVPAVTAVATVMLKRFQAVTVTLRIFASPAVTVQLRKLLQFLVLKPARLLKR